MRHHTLSVATAAAVTLLLACGGCSTSTLVQTASILDLINGETGVASYLDEAAPRLLQGEQVTATAQDVAALRATLQAPEVSRPALGAVLTPVLRTYDDLVRTDPALTEAWRARRLRDGQILRRVAGLSGG